MHRMSDEDDKKAREEELRQISAWSPTKPLKKFHHHGWGNGMSVTLWCPKENAPGRKKYQLRIDKTYKDHKTGSWKFSNTYYVPDALSLIPLLQEAVMFIDQLEENKRTLLGLGEDPTNGLDYQNYKSTEPEEEF